MTMSTADIIKCHKRLRACFQNRSKDPRTKYINAWNGWDGQGDAGRYDVVKGTVTTASSDHKWHIHLEIRRRYVNDRKAMEAILSMLKGEAYVPPTPPVTKPPATNDGDDDEMTQEQFNDWMDEYFARKSAEDGAITSKIGRDALEQGIPQGDPTAPRRPAWWILTDIHRLVREIRNAVSPTEPVPPGSSASNLR